MILVKELLPRPISDLSRGVLENDNANVKRRIASELAKVKRRQQAFIEASQAGLFRPSRLTIIVSKHSFGLEGTLLP